MQAATIEQLRSLLNEGNDANQPFQVERWSLKVKAFLKSAVGPLEAAEFESLVNDDIWNLHAFRVGHLQGLLAKWEGDTLRPSETNSLPTPSSANPPLPAPNSKKVFVVHGHDDPAKESTARFLGKLGLEPIILHEQANSGRTVIEKFETFSGDIAFAVVLLTPDDVGSDVTPPTELKPRARQNVIMELGYFLGRLGRSRVCALHKGGVELPSDYQGVLYIDLDPAGAWKAKLAQEFVQAKISIDLTGLLGG